MTTENIENVEIKEEIQTKEESDQEKFDYKKAREERLIKNTEKKILKDLGVISFEDAKAKISQNEELEKELALQRNNAKKLMTYKSGVDDAFVDYVSYEVNKNLKEGEKFEEALKKFTKDNPQFLKNSSNIKFNSSPDFETPKTIKFNPNKWMNKFLRGKEQK